jgi:GTP-binding protein HflX
MFDIREKPNLVESALLISACFRREEMGEAREMLEELRTSSAR